MQPSPPKGTWPPPQQPKPGPRATIDPKPKRTVGLGAFIASLAVVALVSGSCGFGIGTAGRSTPTVRAVPPTQTVTAPPLPPVAAQAPAPPPAPAPSLPAQPATTIGNGNWTVGVDVLAGRWRSPGPEESIFKLCTASTEGVESGDVVDLETSNDGPAQITLRDGQYFQSSGCLPWTRVS